jgi:hypothetical protein
MKSSPYYRQVREFQEEGSLWEERLTKLRAAFEADKSGIEAFVYWSTKFPAQIMILATQINWSMGVEKSWVTSIAVRH